MMELKIPEEEPLPQDEDAFSKAFATIQQLVDEEGLPCITRSEHFEA